MDQETKEITKALVIAILYASEVVISIEQAAQRADKIIAAAQGKE